MTCATPGAIVRAPRATPDGCSTGICCSCHGHALLLTGAPATQGLLRVGVVDRGFADGNPIRLSEPEGRDHTLFRQHGTTPRPPRAWRVNCDGTGAGSIAAAVPIGTVMYTVDCRQYSRLTCRVRLSRSTLVHRRGRRDRPVAPSRRPTEHVQADVLGKREGAGVERAVRAVTLVPARSGCHRRGESCV